MNRPERFLELGALQQAAAVLRAISHEGRLHVLCLLVEEGELSAGTLTERIGLSQSALSQHLSRLRADGFVATRREGQVVHYRLADPRVAQLLAALHDIYCPDGVGRLIGDKE